MKQNYLTTGICFCWLPAMNFDSCSLWKHMLLCCYIYSCPSLKGQSLERTPLYKGQFFCSKYCECVWCSLLPKDTSLIRTEFFGRRGVLIRWGLLYIYNVHPNRSMIPNTRAPLFEGTNCVRSNGK